MGNAVSEQRSLVDGFRPANHGLEERHAVAKRLGQRAGETVASRRAP
jgi:hypothetical protein